MSRFVVLLAAGLLLGAPGCRKGGVVATPLATSVQRPSNVAFLIDVSSGGEPAPGLESSAFRVSEDGTALDSGTIGLTLLDPALATETGTLLLVDVSGKDEERGQELARAVSGFVEEVRKTQPVWLYVFDGNEEIFEIASFERTGSPAEPSAEEKEGGASEIGEATDKDEPDEATTEDASAAKKEDTPEDPAKPLAPEFDMLAKAATTQPSRNLNGALDKAVTLLDEKLSSGDKPLRSGNIVILISGPDTAGRASGEAFSAQIERSRHQVYAVGPESAPVRDITRDHAFVVEAGQKAESALPAAAQQVVAASRSRYLLSYCSPARRGLRTVSVDVTLPDGKRGDSFDTEFFADGFAEDCEASDTPRFVVTLVHGPSGPVAMAPPGAVAVEEPDDMPSPEPSRAVRRTAPRRGATDVKPAPPKAAPAPKPAAPQTSDGFEP